MSKELKEVKETSKGTDSKEVKEVKETSKGTDGKEVVKLKSTFKGQLNGKLYGNKEEFEKDLKALKESNTPINIMHQEEKCVSEGFDEEAYKKYADDFERFKKLGLPFEKFSEEFDEESYKKYTDDLERFKKYGMPFEKFFENPFSGTHLFERPTFYKSLTTDCPVESCDECKYNDYCDLSASKDNIKSISNDETMGINEYITESAKDIKGTSNAVEEVIKDTPKISTDYRSSLNDYERQLCKNDQIIHQTLNELTGLNKDVVADLNLLNEKILRNAQMIDTVKNNLEYTQNYIDEYIGKFFVEANNNIKENQKVIKMLYGKVGTLIEDIRGLKEDNKDVVGDLNLLNEKILCNENNLKHTQNCIDSRFGEIINAFNKDVKDIQKDIYNIKNVNDNRAQCEEKDIYNLKADVKDIQKDIKKLYGEADTLIEDIKDLKDDNKDFDEDYKDRFECVESDIDDLYDALINLEDTINNKEIPTMPKETSKDACKETIKNIKENLKNTSKEKEEYNKALNDIFGNLFDSIDFNETLKKVLDNYKSTLNEVSEEQSTEESFNLQDMIENLSNILNNSLKDMQK